MKLEKAKLIVGTIYLVIIVGGLALAMVLT